MEILGHSSIAVTLEICTGTNDASRVDDLRVAEREVWKGAQR
jgi:hypothetical protein